MGRGLLTRAVAAFALAALVSPLPALAQSQPQPQASVPLVQKKVFELPAYTTLGGRTIRNVRVGWESYGTLNADKSNAILICHFFSGNSHAAGRYAAQDAAPGYWDAIIGPGKAIDTNKYFVISSDTLVNLSPGDPNVVTTGPASTNPDTGQIYGASFPVVTIGDMVNVEKALVESLGIRKLHAVAGPSMGALQTFEWAARYPEMVGRAMPVIGAGAADAWLIAWLDAWATPIRLDPNWKGGDYAPGAAPTAGLAQALKLVGLQANHWLWADKTFGRAPAEAGKDPALALEGQFKIQAALEASAAARAKVADANHFLYLVKANQLFVAGGAATLEEGMARIKAPILMISSPTDQVFPPYTIEATAAALKKAGVPVEQASVEGPNGHLNGVVHMGQVAETVKAFIDR